MVVKKIEVEKDQIERKGQIIIYALHRRYTQLVTP
jgi:hypothetical protein